MANTKTLADLRAGSLRRADMENSSFISEAEANIYVNDALSELHDILVMSYQDHFQSSDNISIVSGTEAYSLPTDFYKLLAAYWVEGGSRYALDQFEAGEISRYDERLIVPVTSGAHMLYRITGNQLYFAPKPSSSGTVEIWYVPHFTPLAADGTVVSYAICPGWEEYVEVRAAIDMLSKEQSDTTALERKLSRLEARITKASTKRNAGAPQKVRDVYGAKRHAIRRMRVGY